MSSLCFASPDVLVLLSYFVAIKKKGEKQLRLVPATMIEMAPRVPGLSHCAKARLAYTCLCACAGPKRRRGVGFIRTAART